ncbi:unnamed protein product [Allacma fusca]|uniref:EGF-like domain-containing protein n=1 Tax=Allacma fusca TaxID=39272 RepID=A0A8J2LDS9_9HEXA|nr:unnamed protein product [Allacma fusca]
MVEKGAGRKLVVSVICVTVHVVMCTSSDWNSSKCVLPSCVNGKAEHIHGKCLCICDKGFMGPNCEDEDLCSSDNPCHHGGRCYMRHDNQLYCDCPLGYLAPDCRDRDPCATKADHCLNGATCQRLDDIDFACACALPFEGDHCERKNLCRLDVGECADTRTSDNQIFADCYPCSVYITPGGCNLDHSGKYNCSCLPGYTGKACDHLMDSTILETTITLPLEKLFLMNPHNFIVHNIQLPNTPRPVIIAINVSSVYKIHVSLILTISIFRNLFCIKKA